MRRPVDLDALGDEILMGLLDIVTSERDVIDARVLRSKAYGAHLGPYKTPAKKSDPRHLPPNFYFDQEDFVRQAQQGKDWGFSVLRPNTPCGFAVGNPMNLIMVLAVYAAVCLWATQSGGPPAKAQESSHY
jgi:hypothetical protein